MKKPKAGRVAAAVKCFPIRRDRLHRIWKPTASMSDKIALGYLRILLFQRCEVDVSCSGRKTSPR